MEGIDDERWIVCKKCDCYGGTAHTEEQAIKVWNTRADVSEKTSEENKREKTSEGWIPCSDHLPPKPEVGEKGYIIQTKYIIEPYSAYWNGEMWTNEFGDEIFAVEAWMPLPEPWKG